MILLDGLYMKFSKEQRQFLERHQVGRLATASRDAVPHVAALCYAVDEEYVYLHTGQNTKKGRNIGANIHVSFIVDEYIKWEDFRGVMVHGEAEFHVNDAFHGKGRALIYKKYPKWKETYPITESETVLVINPTKIIDWGL